MLSKGKEKMNEDESSNEEFNKYILHHELRIPEIESHLNKWKIPKLEISTLYKSKISDMFKGEYIIKTVERAVDISNSQESFELISKNLIADHIRDFKYLHIGAIQIAIKPLFRKGNDAPLFAVLRDNRAKQLSDQILAVFETNLHEGPVYINNYPNYSVALKSFHETNYNIILDVKILGENWNSRAIPITVIYRIYYKVMKTQLAPQALQMSPKDETTLLLVNPEKVNASVPRILNHSEISSGLKWRLEDIVSPEPAVTAELDNITEFPTGAVEITFAPLRRSLHQVPSLRNSEFSLARQSLDRRSFSIPRNLTLQGIVPDHTTPTPEYTSGPTETNFVSAKSQESPTHSDFSQLNMISVWEADKEILQKDFMNDKNKEKRELFFKYPEREREKLREKYYSHLYTVQKNIPFFRWLDNYKERKINMIKTWKTASTEKQSEFPPLEEVRFLNIENKEVVASPFKMISEKREVSIKDIQNLHSQLNFTNQMLFQLANKKQKKKEKIEEKSLIKPFKFSEEEIKQLKIGQTLDSLYDEVKQKLSISVIKEKPKSNKVMPKRTNPNQEVLDEIEKRLKQTLNDTINVIEETKNSDSCSESPDRIKKIKRNNQRFPVSRNFYTRPTLPDIQSEEWSMDQPSAFDGNGITEWNIDGMTDHQILRKTHEITMAATAYSVKHTEEQTIKLIISGFTGILKGWWDNYLMPEQKNYVLSCVKIENEERIPLMVETLVVAIIHNFIGDPKIFEERTSLFLHNLRCPTLGDFRWYSENFLTMVLTREDCREPFWKERFIAGLPDIFAEKVKENLQKECPNTHLKDVPYGKISSVVKNTGLQLCNNMKIENKIKKSESQGIKELGEFCTQYGYERNTPPSKNKKKMAKRRTGETSAKPARKNFRRSANFRKPVKTNNKPTIVCYKCGRIGHMKRDCRLKEKISNLTISDELKEQMEKLLINSSEEEEEEESIEDSDYESNWDNEDNNCDCVYKINTISSELKFALECIDRINNPEEKTKALIDMKRLLIEKDEPSSSSSRKPEFIGYDFKEILRKAKTSHKEITISDLNGEINKLKAEIESIKVELQELKDKIIHEESISSADENSQEEEASRPSIKEITYKRQKWHVKIALEKGKSFHQNFTALIDSGADLNCIRQRLIPTKYYEKTVQKAYTANDTRLRINYKLSGARICNKGKCFRNDFILTEDISEEIILGTPFLTQIYPFTVTEIGIKTGNVIFEFIKPVKHMEIKRIKDRKEQNFLLQINCRIGQINFIKEEIKYKRTENDIIKYKEELSKLPDKLEKEICADQPTAFWHRHSFEISLPYEDNFSDKLIPTKAKPVQMNKQTLDHCKNEIEELLEKRLIRPSKSPWSCAAFYVNNANEIERGEPRMVINYKPLNKALKWIRYPLPHKQELIKKLFNAVIFSKFDLKSGYYQIKIKEEDKYKTAFVVPFGHYEWNVLPMGLKNAPSEFQEIMNNILNPYSEFAIVYLDDVLIFSNTVDQHIKHLKTFQYIIKKNGLVISKKKMIIGVTKIRFLGQEIFQGKSTPITRSIEFAKKFPDEIKDKTQLQRFLGCLNYVADFIPKVRILAKPLFSRLKKNPPPWGEEQTKSVKELKKLAGTLPCLGIHNPEAKMIVETDASELGFGGILKQKISKEQVIKYHSGAWNETQQKYSTVKKELLSIVLCITKFQNDLMNKEFLLRVDCKSAKEILEKDVKNLVSKQIFARWQSVLSCFDFKIEFIKGEHNYIPDFLTREFLQGHE